MHPILPQRWRDGFIVVSMIICSFLCSASSQDVDLSTLSGPTGFTISGSAGGDQSGFSVHTAGDVNKDGVDDFIIGAPRATPVVNTLTRYRAGMSYVIFGRSVTNGAAASYANVDLTSISIAGTVLGFAIWGVSPNDQSGYSVGKAGDVNKDGIDDLIIGAWQASPPTSRNKAGIVYVVFGRSYISGAASYANVDLSLVSTGNSPLGFAILGAAVNDNTGYSVSGAGDVNKDGVADVIIGAWTADALVSGTTRTGAGIAYVVFGRDTLTGTQSYANIDLASIRTTGNTEGFAIWGSAAADACGSSVAHAGDINKDGIADVVVGAYTADAFVGSARPNSGIVYVIFGRSAANTGTTGYYINIDLLPISTTGSGLGFAILGAQGYDTLGAVSGGRDLNGDTIDDVLVGAYHANSDPDRAGSGVSYVVFGRVNSFTNVDLAVIASAGSTVGFAILGAEIGDSSGYSVSTVSDMNGDGVNDIIIGAYAVNAYPGTNNERYDSGASCVVYGRPLSRGVSSYTNIDLADFATSSSQGYCILGASAFDKSGWSVSAAGDVNKDGLADVVVGSYMTATKGTSTGTSYVVFGAAPVPTSQPSSQPSAQPSVQPSRQPTSQPTRQPSSRPSSQPLSRPSSQPSRQPSARPSAQPTCRPTTQPSSQPSSRPTRQPNSRPSTQPTTRPSSQPSVQPSAQPVGLPSSQPSSKPSGQPSCQPSRQPTGQPSGQPSTQPNGQPSRKPTGQPSAHPSRQPTGQPTSQPSSRPSGQPSNRPSSQPSASPSCQPTTQPSCVPSGQPSTQPSAPPSCQPSSRPSVQPTSVPSSRPLTQPSHAPTAVPSTQPSEQPSSQPSVVPSLQPTVCPSAQPSAVPSGRPSAQPSHVPSTQPTARPSAQPSSRPSSQPSAQPWNNPSSQPSSQPSTRPSGQPATQPSSQPTRQQTAKPTCVPSTQPSTHPSCQPSTQPSGHPSSLPSAVPFSQPTDVPSVQPSSVPSSQHSTQPVADLSSSPSSQPTSTPSTQPTQQPRAVPSAQPSAVPSERPSLGPTGEWATIVQQLTSLSRLFNANGVLWACGENTSGGVELSQCVLVDAVSGVINTQFQFDWRSAITVMSSNFVVSDVMISARSADNRNSDVAACSVHTESLVCTVKAYLDTNFLAAAYVPFAKKYMYIGWYNVYASIAIVDASTSNVQSYTYTARNIKSLTLSQIQSPPYFVGAFVAGTAVRATATPVNYIVAGMVRTEAGIMKAMSLSPLSNDIVNSVDLVNAMALEITGPDSFIAGGLHLEDGSGMHAYLVRANALFATIQYAVRYVPVLSRRVLSASSLSHGVVRGMVLVDTLLYMIVDYTHNNITSLSVMKTSATTGSIIKQVHLSTPTNTSLHCTTIVAAGVCLDILCSYTNASNVVSLLLSVDQELTFSALPAGFVRAENEVFRAENVPFMRTVLTIAKTAVTIPTSTYETTSTGQSPSYRPTFDPSPMPSAQPSSTPSAQPSSSPTAAPSVSAHPTSTPSTSGPTNTNKPSAAPTPAPTKQPSVSPTVRPSFRATVVPSVAPTVQPTLRPSVKPTPKPSALPSAVPVQRPTARPTVVTSRHPSVSISVVPTVAPTAAVMMGDGGGSNMPKYVVGASIGGGLALLIICYAIYRYHEDKEETKAREARKVEYFRQQAILAEQARAETAKYIENENVRNAAAKAEKEQRRGEREAARMRGNHEYSGGGAYAVGAQNEMHVEAVAQVSPTNSDNSLSYNISSLGSSEKSKIKQYRAIKSNKKNTPASKSDNIDNNDNNEWECGQSSVDGGSIVESVSDSSTEESNAGDENSNASDESDESCHDESGSDSSVASSL